MNRINEIGDTVRGQEMLGRTAERAHQRAQRTSGADKQRHEKTEWDAYQTAAGNSRKHLDGSGAHFARGRDAEYDEHWDDGRYPWSKKRKAKNESKSMNKALIRLTEQDLHKIVKESVNKILMEVNFGGKSLHGSNPEDWMEVSKARKGDALDALNGDEYYTDDDERAPYLNKNYRASNRDEINAGRICVDKFVKLRPRVYHRNSIYASQANKVFNRGMGSLAFVNFLVDEKVILVNKVLANKRDMELIQTNFPEWKIEFVSLGYPDWYETKNLKACRGK